MNRKQRAVTLAALAAVALTSTAFADTTPTRTETENGVVNNYWDINISTIKEDAGLELGTGSRARGNGAIATGKNAVAIGNSATATGGNETKDTITKKLNENKQRLTQISDAERTVTDKANLIHRLQAENANAIAAGERIKQARLAKEKALKDANQKQAAYDKAVKDSDQYLKDAKAKIDDFNSRLTAVNRLGNVDINSAEGLTAAATNLKNMVETGTTLDNSVEWYKGYITNYYKAQGDLRLNLQKAVVIDDRQRDRELRNIFLATGDIILKVHQREISGFDTKTGKYIYNSIDDQNGNYWHLIYGRNHAQFGIDLNLYSKKLKTLTLNNGGLNVRNDYRIPDTEIKEVSNLKDINPNLEIISEEEWNKSQIEFDKWKKYIPKFINHSTDSVLAEEDDNKKVITIYTNYIEGLRSKYRAAYLQGKYEETHQTSYIDQKNEALKESKKYFTNGMDLSLSLAENRLDKNQKFKTEAKKWIKENITDIEQANKITTDKLTSDLETSLKINKSAITAKQAELARLKQIADQAKANAAAINPTAADLQYAEQYERIMKQLTTETQNLQSAQERLNALKKVLTLHDLTNVGENAYAIGTSSLATGTNAFAIGTGASAIGENSYAIGKGTTVTGSNSIAVGTGHIVIGNNSGAFGDPDTIYGDNSYSFGNNNIIGSASTPHTVGTNTFVLGSNVTTTANNSVILGNNSTATEDNVVSVGSNGKERKIIHVAKGSVGANSTDAVTGAQLFNPTGESNAAAIRTNWQSFLGNGTNEAGNAGLITGDALHKALDNVKPSVDPSMLAGKADTNASNLNDANVKSWTDKLNSGADVSNPTGKLVTDTNVKNYVDNKVTNTITSTVDGKYINDKLTKGTLTSSSITVTGDGKVLDGSLTLELNKGSITKDKLDAGLVKELDDKATSKDLKDTKDDLSKELATKADTGLSNITKDGEKVITDLVKETVSTDLTTIKKDITTNTTNIATNTKDISTLKGDVSTINTTLTNKADKNASNITTSDAKAWSEKLGTGKAETGDTNLVTGDTVAKAITAATEGIATSATVENKANKDASNLTDTNVKSWTDKLNSGADVSNPTGKLVTDTNVKNYVDNKVTNTITSTVNSDYINGKLTKGSLTSTSITVTGDGKVLDGNLTLELNKGSITKDKLDAGLAKELDDKATSKDLKDTKDDLSKELATKADTGLSNITTAGEKVIIDLVKETVSTDLTTIKKDISTNTTNIATNTKDITTLKGDVSTINNTLATKANKDASNITTSDAKAWSEKLGTGKAETGDTNLVTGDTVAKAITAATEGIATSATVENKANKDASNLTDTNVKSWTDKLNSGADVSNPTGKLVTDTNVKNYVDNKVTNTITSTVDSNYINGKLTKGTLTSSSITVTGDGKLLDGSLMLELNKGSITKDKLDSTLAKELDDKATSKDLKDAKDDLTKELATKADTGLSNITTAGEKVITDLVKETVSTDLTTIKKDIATNTTNIANNSDRLTAVETGKVDKTTYILDKSKVAEALDAADMTNKRQDVSIKAIGDSLHKANDALTVAKGNIEDNAKAIATNKKNIDKTHDVAITTAKALKETTEVFGEAISNNASRLDKAEATMMALDNTKVDKQAYANDKARIGEALDAAEVINKRQDISIKAIGDNLHQANGYIKTLQGDVNTINTTLTTKANRDASNLTATDVAAWTKALGTGSISAGNTGLVTGDTVATVIKEVESHNLVHSHDGVIHVAEKDTASIIDVSHTGQDGKESLRVMTGLVTDTEDATSAVNVYTLNQGLASVSNGMQQSMNSMMSHLESKLSKDINKGTAIATALAGLNPLDYDPDNKLSFSASHGRYNGEKATALGAYIRPNADIMVSLASTLAAGKNAFNAGISFKLGPTSTVKKQDKLDQLQAENEAMKKELVALQEAIKSLQQQAMVVKK